MAKIDIDKFENRPLGHRTARDKRRDFAVALLSAPLVPVLYVAEKIVEKRVKAERADRKILQKTQKTERVKKALQP